MTCSYTSKDVHFNWQSEEMTENIKEEHIREFHRELLTCKVLPRPGTASQVLHSQ